MAKSPNKNTRRENSSTPAGTSAGASSHASSASSSASSGASAGGGKSAAPPPDVEIWSGGLQWALQKGYQKTDTLDGVRQELGLWLENLNELIQAFGPKAQVGEVLEKAGDSETWQPGQARAGEVGDDE